PVIAAAGGPLTIVGNGGTIARSAAPGTPAFRLFDVADGGSLTLEDLTLTGGLAQGTGAAAYGGAVCSAGTLALSGVTVTSNTALGSNGGANAYGGGLYVTAGSATLTNATRSG